MKLVLNLLILFLISSLLIAADNEHHDDHEFEEHGIHEHGYAMANISYIDDSLIVELTLAAKDVFGFENSPKNESEDEIVFLKLSHLENIDNIIATDPACAVTSSVVSSNILPSNDQHNHIEDTHTDVEATYKLRCESSLNLTFKLLKEFTSLEKITVQYVSATEQKLITVTPNNPTILLGQ